MGHNGSNASRSKLGIEDFYDLFFYEILIKSTNCVFEHFVLLTPTGE